ncbi:hypothetical protein SAY86_027392 [Trapa natans]|uniref:Uncharacterized protein n=1 Tax=Trapa natans TaxID=22666 RepID=A0AAN7KMB1_TRANT|nr:hypothetical protein SAY86_027392 [Trapa natans]
MASSSGAQSSENEHRNKENMLLMVESTTSSCGSPARHEEDEDEDEDIDFNPFIRETLSPEASSSLSSEIEGLDDVIVCSAKEPFSTNLVEKLSCNVGDSDQAENERMVDTIDSQVEPCEELLQKTSKASSQTTSAVIQEGDFTKKSVNLSASSPNGTIQHGNLGVLSNDADAICKRTRARYSLAGFTLDELENFLQETDDDEDLQNIDDEEEYRKFLAAVLQGGDDDIQTNENGGGLDDEDEDSDADFEIELEEALDSDYDDRLVDRTLSPSDKSRRRTETRQNRRRNTTLGKKDNLLDNTKRPLRPLLPLAPIGLNLSPAQNGRLLTTANTVAESGYISGFTPHQVGQLYCLIHEHAQLLIQIYSLCILDPSRQQTASQIQELIFEILHKRDQVLACRNIPYPADLFRSPYLSLSMSEESSQLYQNQRMGPFIDNAQGRISASDNMDVAGDAYPSSNGQPEQISCSRLGSSKSFDGFPWQPIIDGPILSILDVAPLHLVKSYMDDMSNAVREHRRRHVESSIDVRIEREPLFSLPSFSNAGEVNLDGVRGELATDTNKGLSSSNGPFKKSLAAALVESTKKQSVALVPREVAQLAQKFLPLFNRALFPHKPPPISVTNRVLFTDTEDELLALGMMEYNTDWKAIQERFLPCKSKHQIFVRQKNRCSSKAPENPIKAVRRMKTSSLTVQEVQYIQEGLKLYKLDWKSIWKLIVPHRDPSLLPRQWRTAVGIQKSYKQNALRKEKRRIYEAERRRRKAADPSSWSNGSEKEDCGSGDDCINEPEEAYIHEAFLADEWRPSASGTMPSQTQRTSSMKPFSKPTVVGAHYGAGNIGQYITQANHLLQPNGASHFSVNQAEKTIPGLDGKHLVKLAPNLPPVNLPRNVRVLSQSAYRTNQHATRVGSTYEGRAANVPDSHQEDSGVLGERSLGVAEERFNSSVLRMHPLLFQAPVDGRLHHPSDPSTSSSGSFNLCTGNRPQLKLSLFMSPNQTIQDLNSFNRNVTQDANSSFSGIEFHPLLKKPDDAERNMKLCFRGSLATASSSQCTFDKANELDLEMHLSSSSKKVKDSERCDKENSGVGLVNRESTDPSRQPFNNLPSVGGLIKGGSRILVDDNDNICMDIVDDQSHPEIVMEQEELSDSEEEFEEQVEFEYEEMTDSEEEDVSCAVVFSEATNKDALNTPVDEVPIVRQEGGDQRQGVHCSPDHTGDGGCLGPSSDLCPDADRKDNKLSRSQLNLLSSESEYRAAECPALLRPKRSCGKRKEPAKQDASLPVRRPRKKPCRNKKDSNATLL